MDLVPWDVFVGEGLLLSADGALSASLRYRGPDPASATEEELLGLGRTLVQAFRPLGDGWMTHFDLHRVPAPDYPEEGAFPDAFTRALDAERRLRYERRRSHYLNEHYLTVTHRAVADGGSPLASLLRPDLDRPGLDGQVDDFEAALEEIVGTLSSVLRLERLDTPGMLRYLYRCLTFRSHPLRVPARTPYTLEHLLGVGDLYGGADLRFGEMHIVPIRFTGFPGDAEPAALDCLNDLPLAFRATFRYLPLDPFTSRQAIKRRRGRWNTAGVGFRHGLALLFGGAGSTPAFSERFAPAMAADADDALLEIETEESAVGYLTATFFTASEDRREAEAAAARLVKHLRNEGYPAAVEDLNALEAYLGALPGQGRANVRRPLFTLAALSSLLPATSVWAGESRHPHPVLSAHPPTVIAGTAGSTPFAFSPAVGDVQHTVVIGPTGAGKSVLLNLLLSQYFRYPKAQVLSLDKGYGQLALVAAAGGDHYDLSADPESSGGHRFAPLAHLETPADQQRAVEWVLALLETAGLDLTPGVKRTVAQGLRDLRHGTTRTLGTFALKAQSHELREALEPYVLDGPYASLFDARTSPIREGSRFSVIEMEHVLALRDAAVVPLTLHLWDELERRLDGRPTLFAVEELAGYLHRPVFARRFSQYLLELRKRNAGLVLVHQNVTGLLDSPLRGAILDIPTKVYLPNPAAGDPALAEAYQALGLNERQVEILARATPKRDYYVVTPQGSRLFQLDLSAASLSILGLAGPTARQTLEDARSAWGSDWLPRYLADLGHQDFVELLGRPRLP
ncbi:MAG TPA: hypothetical protein VJG13_11350 [Thermoanaerobaculia bacterium]|nr:hypothetical protein [Thermoanaerobaculia bacterium]